MKKILLILLFTVPSVCTLKAQNPSNIVRYYFVELIPNTEGPQYTKAQADSIQMAHMGNIRKMAESGKLMLAGPFREGGGLFVLNTSTIEEAEKLCAEDPAVLAGRFKTKVREWYTEKGMLTLELRNK